MSGFMAQVDQRTQLAGHNRMELLLFRLNGKQRFGINVFKVREVVQVPRLTHVPHAHPSVAGVTNIRGKTIPVIDLALATGRRPLENPETCSVIITEYNRKVQGFMVSSVDRIVNMNWKDVLPPPSTATNASYLTAVTKVEGELVQIIDVEKVLSEIITLNIDEEISAEITENLEKAPEDFHVLVADDSLVARNQIKKALTKIGVQITVAKNGEDALQILKGWADEGDTSPLGALIMVLSDIEMPKMDGYTLTTNIRSDDRLCRLYVLLHTSLSGVFNHDMVKKVGADDFLAKFNADELANLVAKRIDDGNVNYHVK